MPCRRFKRSPEIGQSGGLRALHRPITTARLSGIDFLFTFCSYAPNRCRVTGMTDNLLPIAAAAVLVLAGLAALAGLIVLAVRTLRRRDQEAAQAQMAELARLQTETAVRIEGMRD